MFLVLTMIAVSVGMQLGARTDTNKLSASILRQFLDYDLIIHFDNTTVDYLDNTLTARSPDHQAAYLLNYNYKHHTGRPRGFRCINIVLLADPLDFQSYSSRVYNFHQFDFILFVVATTQMDENWVMPGIHRAPTILIYNTQQDQIFHCCYYCGNKTAKLHKTSISNLRSLLNTYSDFNGHVFQVAYTDFPPFFWREPHESRARGAEGELLEEFSRVHNFKYELVRYQNRPGKGAWQAMVEGVEAGRADWAVGGLSVTIKRGIYTDFTRYIKTQGFSVLYAVYQETWSAFEKFLLVFKWIVWVGIVTTVLVICLVAKTANDRAGVAEKYWEYAKVALLPIAEQGASGRQMKLITLISVRILFLIWWLSSSSLTSMYKSQLASSLIRPIYNQPNRIDELVEKDFRFHVNTDDWSVLRENLETSSDKVYSKILTRVEDNLEFCSSVLALLGRKLAVIDEEIPIQYDVRHSTPICHF
jgi:hypothetical protein